MTNPAIKRFREDYMALNMGLKIPHPYFQQIEYIKLNSMIIKEVVFRRHDKILDIGSGAGHLIHGLSAVSNGCMALDIEGQRLKEIIKKSPNISCVQANGEEGLPFKSETFDIVIASELLEHLNNPMSFYREVARVLRKKGILVVTTPNSDNLTFKILRRLPKTLAASMTKRAGADLNLHPEFSGDRILDRKNPHLHKVEGYTQKQLLEFGRDCNLEATFLRTFGLAIPDRAYSYLPKILTRLIVNRIEDHVLYGLRHIVVYENK